MQSFPEQKKAFFVSGLSGAGEAMVTKLFLTNPASTHKNETAVLRVLSFAIPSPPLCLATVLPLPLSYPCLNLLKHVTDGLFLITPEQFRRVISV